MGPQKLFTIKEIAEMFNVKDHQVRYALKMYPEKFKPRKYGWQIFGTKIPKTWPVGR